MSEASLILIDFAHIGKELRMMAQSAVRYALSSTGGLLVREAETEANS